MVLLNTIIISVFLVSLVGMIIILAIGIRSVTSLDATTLSKIMMSSIELFKI